MTEATLRVALVKPPEQSKMDFGTFSLEVLAAEVIDIAAVDILDATGLSIEKATFEITRRKPDFIGITAMGLRSVEPVCASIKAIRKANFRGKIIVGGHGASMSPHIILENGADCVVYGEGESTFREILQLGISQKTRGIYLLKDGHLIKTPQRDFINLEDVKEPARNLVSQRTDGFFLLETSRGCPHKCSFCESSRFYSCNWRERSPSTVVKDIHKLLEIGAMVIQLSDDNFTADPKRAKEICKLLKNGPLPLFFIFSARSDDLIRDPELIPALAESNFLRVTIGVETLIPEIAKFVGKNISFNQHKQAFDLLRKAEIFSMASYIVGLPGETEEMRKTYVELATKLSDSATFLPFQPLPGTPMFKGNAEPEEWAKEYSLKLNMEFSHHPVSNRRLMLAAKKKTVRGMLARAILKNRINDSG